MMVPVHATTLKIATLSPEGSMWMEKMRKGADEVAQKTGSRVKFKFYPGGVMGNDQAVLRKIRIGQLHGGAVVSGSLSQFFPANQLYTQPMKFSSHEEVDYVRERMDPFIINGLEEAGFKILGIAGGGFAYIMSKVPIETVQDLKIQKVWLPDNHKISPEAIQTFGFTPIPLPISDVRTSLQSGLINTIATSPVGAVVLQWHTQIKYVTYVPLAYLHAVLAVNKKKFSKIDPQDQKVVLMTMQKIFREIDLQNREDDVRAIETLKKRGVKFITPSGDVMEEWKETAQKASKKMVESGTLPKEVANTMDQHIAQFNAKSDKTNDQ
ncbi:MAG: C4-dicarboxylate ABC transporter [Desulfobacteraceae bacterium]|nr:C4-dicarboxylate ABC transporter [Desulfobacteraceae bacterium]